MKSVTGGGHFGGGMFISAYDLARFGYLFLKPVGGATDSWSPRSGSRWRSTPGPANAGYGFCNWFLNKPETRADGTEDSLPLPSTPRSSVTFQGNGVNVVYLDWEHDLVVVVRWIDTNESLDQFLGKVIAAITSS